MTGGSLWTFTVSIAGPERHDGEAPFTYVVQARDIPEAYEIALLHHVLTEHEDIFRLVLSGPDNDDHGEPFFTMVEGEHYTFPGIPPETAWYNYIDLRAS